MPADGYEFSIHGTPLFLLHPLSVPREIIVLLEGTRPALFFDPQKGCGESDDPRSTYGDGFDQPAMNGSTE